MKKFLASVSAAVMCISPMINTSLVNAARSDQLNTYAVYCDVPANSGVMFADLEIYYNKEGNYFPEATLGDFKGDLSLFPSTTSCVTSFRSEAPMAACGNLFRVNFWSKSDFGTKSMRALAFDSKHRYMGDNIITTELVLVGDANQDEHVTIADATLILQYITNPPEYTPKNLRAADVNYDGLVTKEDAHLIQMYDAGAIDRF